MKIVIDIPETAYEAYKEWHKNKVASVEQSIIANGKPYEDRPIGYWKDHRWCSNCGCGIPTDVYGTSITEEETHFCVECGARMEAENEDNDRNP